MIAGSDRLAGQGIDQLPWRIGDMWMRLGLARQVVVYGSCNVLCWLETTMTLRGTDTPVLPKPTVRFPVNSPNAESGAEPTASAPAPMARPQAGWGTLTGVIHATGETIVTGPVVARPSSLA